jgi:hypothetical protein
MAEQLAPVAVCEKATFGMESRIIIEKGTHLCRKIGKSGAGSDATRNFIAESAYI